MECTRAHAHCFLFSKTLDRKGGFRYAWMLIREFLDSHSHLNTYRQRGEEDLEQELKMRRKTDSSSTSPTTPDKNRLKNLPAHVPSGHTPKGTRCTYTRNRSAQIRGVHTSEVALPRYKVYIHHRSLCLVRGAHPHGAPAYMAYRRNHR